MQEDARDFLTPNHKEDTMKIYSDLESARGDHAKHGGILLELNSALGTYQIVDFETAVDMRQGSFGDCHCHCPSQQKVYEAAYWARMGATDFDETRGVAPSGPIGTWVDILKAASNH